MVNRVSSARGADTRSGAVRCAIPGRDIPWLSDRTLATRADREGAARGCGSGPSARLNGQRPVPEGRDRSVRPRFMGVRESGLSLRAEPASNGPREPRVVAFTWATAPIRRVGPALSVAEVRMCLFCGCSRGGNFPVRSSALRCPGVGYGVIPPFVFTRELHLPAGRTAARPGPSRDRGRGPNWSLSAWRLRARRSPA